MSNNLAQIVSRIEELNLILKTDLEDVPRPNRGAVEGLQNQAKQELLTLQTQYKATVARSFEPIIIAGAGESDAVKVLKDMKVITVDAQQMYKDLENIVFPMTGTVRLDETAFMKLSPMISNLHVFTGQRMAKELVFEETPTQESLAATFSELVRNQLG
jgi:hypothetical protein